MDSKPTKIQYYSSITPQEIEWLYALSLKSWKTKAPALLIDRYPGSPVKRSREELIEYSEYVQMLADQRRQRLLVWSCKQFDKASVKWSNIKNGKPGSRNVRAKILCAKIFRMMNWNINFRYKIMAVYQELDELRFTVFNLEECEMYVPQEQTLPDGTVKKKRNKVFPIDWDKTFGTPYAQHSATYETDLSALHLLSNSTLDDLNEKSVIVPRAPTPGEIITRNYYVPDNIVEKGKIT